MKKTEKNIRQILDAYFDKRSRLDNRLTALVQGWLAMRMARGEADAQLRRIFDRMLAQKRQALSDEALAMLHRLHDELGFTDRRVPEHKGNAGRKVWMGVAAAAAVMAGVVWVPRLLKEAPEVAPQIATVSFRVPQTRGVTLPDGSELQVQAGSRLSYTDDFLANRSVQLDGEALFDVRKDTEHPFTVRARDMMVTVTGTEFNVDAWDGEAKSEVVLISGGVELSAAGSVRTLAPGERAQIDRAASTISVSEAAPEELRRLNHEGISFNDVSLRQALDMIGRYYHARVEATADLPAVDGIVLRMAGDATLQQALQMLQDVNPVFDFEIEENGTVIVKNK